MKKEEEEDDDCSEGGDNTHVKPELFSMEKDLFEFIARYHHMITCAKWFPLRVSLFDKDVMIQKLVITDSDGQGKIVACKDGGEETNVYQLKWQFWYVPVLQLPNSRGVMRGVKLAVSKAVGGDGDGDLVCSADGEKTVLWEAASQIMRQKLIRSSLQKLGLFC